MKLCKIAALFFFALLFTSLLGCGAEIKSAKQTPSTNTLLYIPVTKNIHFPGYMEVDSDTLEMLSRDATLQNTKEGKKQESALIKKSNSILQSKKEKFRLSNDLPRPLLRNNTVLFPFNLSVYEYGINDSAYFDLSLHSSINGCETNLSTKKIPSSEMHTSTDVFFNNSFDCLLSQIESLEGNITLLGSDHGLSLLSIRLAHHLDPSARIGMIVFDEHTDLYGTMDENNSLSKANVFGKALIEGEIEYVLFLGTSPYAKDTLSQSVHPSFSRKELFERISAQSDKDMAGEDAQIIIEKEIATMKSFGVTTILISIDSDVLSSSYTGFEYSLLAPKVSALRRDAPLATLAEREEGFGRGLEPEEIIPLIRFIKTEGENKGISIGATNGKLSFFMDLMEYLPKQDDGNRTAGALSLIEKSLTA